MQHTQRACQHANVAEEPRNIGRMWSRRHPYQTRCASTPSQAKVHARSLTRSCAPNTGRVWTRFCRASATSLAHCDYRRVVARERVACLAVCLLACVPACVLGVFLPASCMFACMRHACLLPTGMPAGANRTFPLSYLSSSFVFCVVFFVAFVFFLFVFFYFFMFFCFVFLFFFWFVFCFFLFFASERCVLHRFGRFALLSASIYIVFIWVQCLASLGRVRMAFAN